jgi:hypothetical protein
MASKLRPQVSLVAALLCSTFAVPANASTVSLLDDPDSDGPGAATESMNVPG